MKAPPARTSRRLSVGRRVAKRYVSHYDVHGIPSSSAWYLGTVFEARADGSASALFDDNEVVELSPSEAAGARAAFADLMQPGAYDKWVAPTERCTFAATSYDVGTGMPKFLGEFRTVKEAASTLERAFGKGNLPIEEEVRVATPRAKAPARRRRKRFPDAPSSLENLLAAAEEVARSDDEVGAFVVSCLGSGRAKLSQHGICRRIRA